MRRYIAVVVLAVAALFMATPAEAIGPGFVRLTKVSNSCESSEVDVGVINVPQGMGTLGGQWRMCVGF